VWWENDDILGIDSEVLICILAVIIVIETLYLIIQGRRYSRGIDPATC
jgi:hypothetical protein